MSLDGRSVAEGRCDGHTGLRALDGHAFAVVTMAGEAEFAIDGLTLDEKFVLFSRVIASADLIGTGQNNRTQLTHSLGGGSKQGLLLELGKVWPGLNFVRTEDLGGHDGLEGDVGILIDAELGEVFDERLIAGPDERFAGAEALAAEIGILVGEKRTHGLGLKRTEAFEGPERMDASEGLLAAER